MRMWRADYLRRPYPKGEWRMGLSLRGVRNVRVFGLTSRETGGDGIYLDASEQAKGIPTTRYNCEDVVIRDVLSIGNYKTRILRGSYCTSGRQEGDGHTRFTRASFLATPVIRGAF